LRICYAVITTFAFESRISWIFASLNSSEKAFEGKLYSQNYVLKSERMNFIILRMINFELWQSILSLKAVDLSLLFLPSVLSIC
jgi:hypothetical protein